MREAVLDRLHMEFGGPVRETLTACCWNLAAGFDMIAERDSLPHQGVVWIPWEDRGSGPEFSEFYDGATNRHPGTYDPSCPSLAKGRSALRISVQWQYELDAAIEQIRALAKR